MFNKKILLEVNKLNAASNKTEIELAKTLGRKVKPYNPGKAKAIITVSHVRKFFGYSAKTAKVVLKDIDFNIYEGDCIALVGANGAGKTTLIEIISGIQETSYGKIIYNLDYKYTPQERIGIQFQQSTYPSGISVMDIIKFSMEIARIKPKKEELQKLLQAFSIADLTHFSARNLSGGQQQRLNALLGVINKPQFLMLDELTTGLDVVTQNSITKFLKKYLEEHKITTLLSSHNMNEITTLCNRFILLRKGRIIVDTTVKEIVRVFGTVEGFLREYME